MWEFTSTTERIRQLRRLVRRETVGLVVLTAVAAGAFLATRALAIEAEHLAHDDAARWYERGQALLDEGRAEDAAVAFRRAAMKHRGEKRYVLGLAAALGRSGNIQPAERALLELRELSPEDADVNLALARLARQRGDTAAAVRYYHHAIYAPAATAISSRTVRFELVEFLLDTNQQAAALAELIAASIDLPADQQVRLDLADLFLRAENPGRAAEQYARVLEQDQDNLRAAEGAVRAAFLLGDYRAAAGYRPPPAAAAEVHRLVAVAREVLARDPLASRISAGERRRRILLNLNYLERRWDECGSGPGETAEMPAELVALRAAARRAAIGRDTEALENAVATLDRMRQTVTSRCGEATAVDEAIDLIARSHGLAAS